MAGINDVSHDLSTDSVVTLITKVIEKIQTESPRTKLYIQSLLPINDSFGRYKTMTGKTDLIPEINRKLEALAKEHDSVKSAIEGKTIRKVIAVPGRLVNIVAN